MSEHREQESRWLAGSGGMTCMQNRNCRAKLTALGDEFHDLSC
ncbi:hypothetical protein ACLK1S_00170 [Escherichia coli]